MITGNKGEWSEVYTLFKIIADKQLFAGDSTLNKVASLFFPIIKILRDETSGTFEFSYDNDLVVIRNGSAEFKISVLDFKTQAEVLLRKLQQKTTTTFSVAEIEIFINSFGSNSIKTKSTVKSDIRIVIDDLRTSTVSELGFSIKSQLGNPSTLLNAGKTTNFIYKIADLSLTPHEIARINAINTRSKIKDRIEKIFTLGGKFEFQKTESSVFGNNLIFIDSALPTIIAETLLLFFTSTYSTILDLISQISTVNPLNYNLEDGHPFYVNKIKRFLTHSALGMVPSIVWAGEFDVTGGVLVVKKNGDILCYHIYNKSDFENYLFANTKLETASSTRHDFGVIYEENGELFFKLNLQIRFK
jgi:type II restriction enzyme